MEQDKEVNPHLLAVACGGCALTDRGCDGGTHLDGSRAPTWVWQGYPSGWVGDIHLGMVAELWYNSLERMENYYVCAQGKTGHKGIKRAGLRLVSGGAREKGMRGCANTR